MLAYRGYDTNGILEIAHSKRMEALILPKRNRKNQREYNQEIYENRYQVENAFLKLKRWRGIATRYTKKAKSYTAAVQISCMYQWLCVL